MKPSWKSASPWHKWVAMDESGVWVWYSKKPYPDYDQQFGGYWLTLPKTRFTITDNVKSRKK